MSMRIAPAIAFLLLLATTGCREESAPAPPPRPTNGQVTATVASFRVTPGPEGVETVDQIAVWNNLIRLPDETGTWRLFDIGARTVTIVDEIARRVERRSFDEIISDLRLASRQNQTTPVASVQPTGQSEAVAGWETDQFRITIGDAYERQLWISRRPLFHSKFFLLCLATDSIPSDNLPALRRVINLLDQQEGYPLRDQSRMILDGREYSIERVLIAVSEQQVPASWFELPPWAQTALTGSRGDRPPAASPRSDRSTREAESRPSGSDRTDP